MHAGNEIAGAVSRMVIDDPYGQRFHHRPHKLFIVEEAHLDTGEVSGHERG